MFVIISGPSGVGKNTIIEKLLSRNKDFEYLLTYTTREFERENDSKNYVHFSREEMQKKIDAGEMFEYEEIHSNIYGTPKIYAEALKSPNKVYFKDLGVLGKAFFDKNLKDAKVVSIFLDAEEDVLRERLAKRGEKNIDKRMQRIQFERSFRDEYNFVIRNDDIEKTVKKIEQVIELVK